MTRRKNKAAQALGRLAAGIPKRYSPEELIIRGTRIIEARRKFLARKQKRNKTRKNT